MFDFIYSWCKKQLENECNTLQKKQKTQGISQILSKSKNHAILDAGLPLLSGSAEISRI